MRDFHGWQFLPLQPFVTFAAGVHKGKRSGGDREVVTVS